MGKNVGQERRRPHQPPGVWREDRRPPLRDAVVAEVPPTAAAWRAPPPPPRAGSAGSSARTRPPARPSRARSRRTSSPAWSAGWRRSKSFSRGDDLASLRRVASPGDTEGRLAPPGTAREATASNRRTRRRAAGRGTVHRRPPRPRPPRREAAALLRCLHEEDFERDVGAWLGVEIRQQLCGLTLRSFVSTPEGAATASRLVEALMARRTRADLSLVGCARD